MSSLKAFADITAARMKLDKLVQGLKAAASGEVVDRAAGKVQALLERVAKEKLGRHVDSGSALGSLEVTRDGGLVRLKDHRYLNYHTWWPFRRGVPTSIVKLASEIFAGELRTAIMHTGAPPALTEAVDIAAGVEAGRKARAEKKEQREREKASRQQERKEQREREKASRREQRASEKAERKRARENA